MSISSALQISGGTITTSSRDVHFAPVRYALYDPFAVVPDVEINGTYPSKTVIPVNYGLLTNKVNPAATGNVDDGSLSAAVASAAQPRFVQGSDTSGLGGAWYHSVNDPDAGQTIVYAAPTGPLQVANESSATTVALTVGASIDTTA
jgi:hypothetical protein